METVQVPRTMFWPVRDTIVMRTGYSEFERIKMEERARQLLIACGGVDCGLRLIEIPPLHTIEIRAFWSFEEHKIIYIERKEMQWKKKPVP